MNNKAQQTNAKTWIWTNEYGETHLTMNKPIYEETDLNKQIIMKKQRWRNTYGETNLNKQIWNKYEEHTHEETTMSNIYSMKKQNRTNKCEETNMKKRIWTKEPEQTNMKCGLTKICSLGTMCWYTQNKLRCADSIWTTLTTGAVGVCVCASSI